MSDVRRDPDGTYSRICYYLSTDQSWYGAAPSLHGDYLRIGRDGVSASGVRDPHVGCDWEFTVTLIDLSSTAPYGKEVKHLRASVYDDAWAAYGEVPEFFAHLATLAHGATLADLAEWCAGQGWLDIADRVGLNGARA